MLTSYMDEWVDVYRSGHMDVAYARYVGKDRSNKCTAG